METEKSEQPVAKVLHPRAFGVGALVIIVLFVVMLMCVVGGFAMHRAAYRTVYTGQRGMMMSGVANERGGRGMMSRRGVVGTHRGLLGSVSKIDGATLTIHNSTADTAVAVLDTTSIYKNGIIAKQSDIKTGDVVTITGVPNSNGVVQASIIQIR